MNYMFAWAKSFNKPINKWEFKNIKDISSMFLKAIAFNQNLNAWDFWKYKTSKEWFKGVFQWSRMEEKNYPKIKN